MSFLVLEGMEFFAYHGCFEEERIIGGKFTVDLQMEIDTSDAEKTDDLKTTVNYLRVYELVKKEIEIKSKLLEHLAGRIADSVMNTFPAIISLKLTVSKINPPLGGKTAKVSLTIQRSRF